MPPLLCALASIGFLGLFSGSAFSHPIFATTWAPEQWAFLSAAIISAIGSAIAAIITAGRVSSVHRDIKLPSNGISLGELLEAMAQVQHYLVHKDTAADVAYPSATEIARETKREAEGRDQ